MTTTRELSGASSMNFFEHQDQAKARSRKFTLLYTIAVILVCVAVSLVITAIIWMLSDLPPQQKTNLTIIALPLSALATALLIALGSLYRIAQLKGGGSVVARSLGGQLIDPSTRQPLERQLLNVVEEMAIASGVPVPPVYIMPGEKNINAFAAGYAPGDAVIGVTKGCIEGLTRDELQGVIAHEFSHILHGDMKLNIRMIGFLNGILLLTIIGQLLLRSSPHFSRSKNGWAVTVVLIAIAVSILAIGSIGALAAKLIQASVSRQREYLADASAVQFTRNPTGIANALRRLGHKPSSTKIKHPRAQESSHMFFGKAISLGASLSTHPPLKERIKRIDPAWDGTFLPPLPPSESQSQTQSKKQNPLDKLTSQLPTIPGLANPALPNPATILTPETLLPLLALTGTLTPQHIDHAKTIITAIPQPLKDAAHDITHSRAVVYALLLDRQSTQVRQSQIQQLKEVGDPAIARVVEQLAPHALSLNTELRLPLLDMTLASLAHLSDDQHTTFRANVKALAQMDQSIDLFEWVTLTVLTRHLDERFGLASRTPTQYYALNKITHDVNILLSTIAHSGTRPPKPPATTTPQAQAAFDLGAKTLTQSVQQHLKQTLSPTDLTLLPIDQATLKALDHSLKTLNLCSYKLKRELLKACALTAATDQSITTTEAELLRAIADALGVPTPPLPPNQQPPQPTTHLANFQSS